MSSTVQSDLQITVNGAAHAWRGHCVADLVSELALDPRSVAVELNRAIVPRSQYATTTIRGGDEVEIVRFIGGG